MWRKGDLSNSQTHALCYGVLGSAKGQCCFSETQLLPGFLSWLHFSLSLPSTSVLPCPTQITAMYYFQSCLLYPLSAQPSECLCHSFSAQNPAVALQGLLGRARRGLLALTDLFNQCVTTAPLHTPSIACSQTCNSWAHQLLCPASGPLHMPFLGPDFSSLDFNPIPYLLLKFSLYAQAK